MTAPPLETSLAPVPETQVPESSSDYSDYLDAVYQLLPGFDTPDSPYFDRSNDPIAIQGGIDTCNHLAQGGTLDSYTVTIRKWRASDPRYHAFLLASSFAAMLHMCPEYGSQIMEE